ncbi:YtxH domain-containing protein [Natronogracilivirga saccharolytica]|uniref:YtxH domain-containing protein n=1 Tax=Natronogracilivirga saccharolytica TaxID=2812953 RepID=A0A8J7S859_9BACT|nr:YtxH domain-containing protein [Natronogracilivirga saccharolytica]MBP3192038.1 YtxH domain-containing protein [Natronogracilivirga saccharolytica]
MSKFPKGFIFGIISGSVIGSLIALLYAPDKGATTRDRISYRLNNYVDELSSLVDRLQKEKGIVSDAKKEGDLVVEEAQKRAEDLISEAEKLLENIGDTKGDDAKGDGNRNN